MSNVDAENPVIEMILACDEAAELIRSRAERLTAMLANADDPLNRDQRWVPIQSVTEMAKVNTVVMNMMLTVPLASMTSDL